MRSNPALPELAPLQSALTLLLLALFSVVAFGVKFFDALSPQDEAILLVYPDFILRGLVPARDFAAPYPPGNFYLLASAYALFGPQVFVERIVGIGYQYLIVAAVYLIGSRIAWSTGVLAAAVALLVLRLFPIPGAYSIFGAQAVMLFGLLCAQRSCASEDVERQRRWAILAGLLAGATCWFRQDLGVLGTLVMLVALRPQLSSRLRFFMLGFALPMGAMLIYMMVAGPSAFFDSLVLDLLRQGPGRALPVQSSAPLNALAVCVVVNVIIAAGLHRFTDRQPLVWLTRGIAVLSVGVLPSVLQRADIAHIVAVGAAVAGLTVVSLSILLMQANKHRGISAKGAASALLAASAVFGIVSGVAFARNVGKSSDAADRIVSTGRWVPAKDGFFPGDKALTADANRLLSELNKLAAPGDTLFVGPRDLRFSNYNDTFFYYLLPHLQPVARYLEMNPGAANRPGSGLAEQIPAARWLILTSRYEPWPEPNASSIPGSPLPNDIVKRYFCVHSEHGVWQLLRRCASTVPG